MTSKPLPTFERSFFRHTMVHISTVGRLDGNGKKWNHESLGKAIKGTVVSVVADNLGAHSVAGFVESFAGSYICRFCVGERSKFQSNELLPVDMAPSAKLRIIFGEDDVHKLLLPAGIPSTLQDLNDVLRETFDITGPFTVMYQDMDFDGQFFTLTSIEEVQDKANLKVVKTESVILSLTTVDMSEVESPVPLSTEASSSSVCDTILLSSPDESGPSYRSKPWPFKFEIPDFSYDIDLALEAGKQAYENDGTLLNNPSVTSSILEKLAETIFGFTAYPTGVQILAVAEALVAKYPRLKEPGSFNGLYGWQQRIKYKMGNYRAKLRGRQLAIPELEHHVDGRRDIIIRCLVEYLGESGEELIKDHQDVSQEALKEDCSNHMMKIIVIHPNVAQENQDPVNVSVIIEGTEILEDCGSVINACLLLMGVIYAVNLSYPLKLKYTFEVFQKLFLELDILKMSPKVQSLHKKLLAVGSSPCNRKVASSSPGLDSLGRCVLGQDTSPVAYWWWSEGPVAPVSGSLASVSAPQGGCGYNNMGLMFQKITQGRMVTGSTWVRAEDNVLFKLC
ncbi:hypothetical protein ACER0C_014850 [Sarotherodon galilaeus]